MLFQAHRLARQGLAEKQLTPQQPECRPCSALAAASIQISGYSSVRQVRSGYGLRRRLIHLARRRSPSLATRADSCSGCRSSERTIERSASCASQVALRTAVAVSPGLDASDACAHDARFAQGVRGRFAAVESRAGSTTTLSRESPAKPVEANGGPLSERILVGRPYSRKVASISGRTCAVSLRSTL